MDAVSFYVFSFILLGSPDMSLEQGKNACQDAMTAVEEMLVEKGYKLGVMKLSCKKTVSEKET